MKTGSKTGKAKKKIKEDVSAKSLPFSPPSSERVQEIIQLLKEAHPDAKIALEFEDPLELITATILSAQCTDERVNKVTPVLFERFDTAEKLAEAPIDELKEIIRSTGFFNQKAKYIKEMAQGLMLRFDGKVPDNMKDLLTLTGVARKTANVVLAGAFGKSEGIVVDTHVKRVSGRLGLTGSKNPDIIERHLMEIIPKDEWIFFGNALVFHGRRFCQARKPQCQACPLNEKCPSAFTF